MAVRLYLSTLFLCYACCAAGHPGDTIFYDSGWKLCARDTAAYFRPAPAFIDSAYVVNDYYINGRLQMTGHFSSMAPELRNGWFLFFDGHGQVESRQHFPHGNEADTILYYYDRHPVKQIIYDPKMGGYHNSYYDSSTGGLVRCGAVRNAERQGTWTFYTPNGKLWRTQTYLNGRSEGCVCEYDTVTGHAVDERVRIDGFSHGEVVLYTPAGRRYKTIRYVRGIRSGPVNYYDTLNGYVSATFMYKNDTMTGHAAYYNTSCGILRSEGDLIARKREGPWRWYYECTNIPYSVIDFKNDQRDGRYVAYDKTSGKIISEGNNKNGVEDGEWKYYYPSSGVLRQVAHFKDGRLNGPLTTWWPDGALRRREDYDDGTMMTWNCYTECEADTIFYPRFIAASFLNEPDYYFGHWIEYPQEMSGKTEIGRVRVQITIEPDKYISDARIIESSNAAFDAEVMRIAGLLPVMEAATEDGVPVYSRQTFNVYVKPQPE